MYKSSYANLSDLKDMLGITATTDDTTLRKTLERASKEIESYTGRTFYSVSATKYFDGNSPLWIPDLLSITPSGLQLDEDGNASFESILTTSDYVLYGVSEVDSLNTFPINRIEISDNSDYGGFANGIKKGVKITGNWGYGDGTSAPYYAETTLAASVSSGTIASVSVNDALSPGMTALIGTEQIFINSGSTSLGVERGVNGSTAAVHASGETIYVYKYPKDIENACLDLASALWNLRGKQGIQSERIGDYSYNLISQYSEGGKIRSTIQKILDDEIFYYKKVHL